jgi:tetratricopeptide (TPR) repeat protein
MHKHLPILTAFLGLGPVMVAAIADDGKPTQSAKTASPPATSAKAQMSNAPANQAEPIKETLKKALKQVQAMAEEAAKSGRRISFESPNMFAMRFSKELEADVANSIGRAQANIGSIEDARATWQSALDAVTEISSLDPHGDRANLYAEIAKAQCEAGEGSEARLSLRQALKSARAIRAESGLPFEPPTGIPGFPEPLAKKADVLATIARLQGELGDKAASDDALRLAVETAESIKEPPGRVKHLLEIAQGVPGETAKALWSKTFEFALTLKDEYPRVKAVEAVIRARLHTLPAEETLALITDRLKGDLQHYALWVVADYIAASDKQFAKPTVARLGQLASKADFDRTSKKIKVFERIAQAQARLGDFEGAYQSAGAPEPVNNVQTFRATQARAHVMVAIAEAQLKAKQTDAAKETVHAALEMISPLPAEDAEAYYPLAELCHLLAKAGDIEGALHTVGAVSSSSWKVSILSEIAVAHAEAGRRDESKKTLQLAREAARGAANDTLWHFISSPAQSRNLFGDAVDPSLAVLQALASAEARIGDLDAALKTVAEMGDSAFGKFSRKQAIDQIVTTRLDKADFAGGRRAADLLSDADSFMSSKPDLLEQIARRQARHGDAAGVLAWAGDQKLPKVKLQVLRGMANGIVERLAAEKPTAPPSASVMATPAK